MKEPDLTAMMMEEKASDLKEDGMDDEEERMDNNEGEESSDPVKSPVAFKNLVIKILEDN